MHIEKNYKNNCPENIKLFNRNIKSADEQN
jgi:hypothetical protein